MSNKIKTKTEFDEFDDVEEAEEFEDNDNVEEDKKAAGPRTKHFAYWTVAGKTYKLKLKTKQIEELESKYRTNLVNLIGNESGMVSLKIMLDITHNAMKEWHHGVKYNHIVNMFDKYVEEGGSQLKFFTEIYMNIYIVSGFFSPEMATEISNAMKEALTEM